MNHIGMYSAQQTGLALTALYYASKHLKYVKLGEHQCWLLEKGMSESTLSSHSSDLAVSDTNEIDQMTKI